MSAVSKKRTLEITPEQRLFLEFMPLMKTRLSL